MGQSRYTITTSTKNDLQLQAFEMIMQYIATVLPRVFDSDELGEISPSVYYTEKNGFYYSKDETGSFFVRFRSGAWAMQVGLMRNGGLVAFFHPKGTDKVQYELSRFYTKEENHLMLSPFHTKWDFMRFRKELQYVDPRRPIGSLNGLCSVQ